MGKNWKIYSVSPLFNFDPDSSPSQLSTKLTAHFGENISAETQKGLRGNREDCECLKITSKKCSIYFTSINSTEFDLKTSKVAILPLALTLGSDEFLLKILMKIEQFFDCVINPILLENSDLKWMSALWSGNVQNSEDEIRVRFALPIKIKGIDHLEVKFQAEQIQQIWKK